MKFTNEAIGAMGHLIALSSLKFPLGFKLYLNLIPILIGLVFFLKFRPKEELKIFWPMILMLVINFIPLSMVSAWKGFFRLGQVFCLINFAIFISRYWKVEDTKKYSELTTILASVFLVLEIIFIGPDGMKNYLGLNIPRYMGFLGESNYSAIIIAFNSMLLLIGRRYLLLLINVIILFFLASRTGLVTVMAFVLLYFMSFKFHAVNKRLLLIIPLLALMPIWVFLIFRFAPLELIVWIEKVSNGRFFLWLPYVDMGMGNFLGVGYFQGWLRYADYLVPFKELADSIRGHQLNEQHNFFIHIFSEFGIFGWLLIIIQIVTLLKRVENGAIKIMFLSLLIGYSFLNGFNDYILYLVFGLHLKNLQADQKVV